MSKVSIGTLLADATSLVFAYRAGGIDLLNAYVADAAKLGLTVAITDRVAAEIADGPLSPLLGEWIWDHHIVVKPTRTNAALLSGHLGPENAGEKSMLEFAEQAGSKGEWVFYCSWPV
jgi:hypothetical protein